MDAELLPATESWAELIAGIGRAPRTRCRSHHRDAVCRAPGAALQGRVRLDAPGWNSGHPYEAVHSEVASSNQYGKDPAEGIFEGRGCIVDPGGQTVAETSQRERLVVHEVSTEFVSVKRTTIPATSNRAMRRAAGSTDDRDEGLILTRRPALRRRPVPSSRTRASGGCL